MCGRLIDADALKDRVGYIEEEYGHIMEEINNAPTVDAVSVVRCKDCVHCADDWNGNQPMFTCELGMCGESVQPSDFCAHGESDKNESA